VSACCLKGVDGPVPAVGRLEHHLGVLTGPGDHCVKPVDVVDDPDRLEHLTGPGAPYDHAASSVQIDTDELLPCVL
jgi:hypothetical protein